jgi:hypothetical protein
LEQVNNCFIKIFVFNILITNKKKELVRAKVKERKIVGAKLTVSLRHLKKITFGTICDVQTDVDGRKATMKVLCNDPFKGELEVEENSLIQIIDYETVVNIHGASSSQICDSSSQRADSTSQAASKENERNVNILL